MNLKTFTCPKCGGTLQYNEMKDILSCPYCGAAVEKESGTVEKILRYKERKSEKELAEKKRQEGRTEEGLKSLRIMMLVIVLAIILMRILGIK